MSRHDSSFRQDMHAFSSAAPMLPTLMPARELASPPELRTQPAEDAHDGVFDMDMDMDMDAQPPMLARTFSQRIPPCDRVQASLVASTGHLPWLGTSATGPGAPASSRTTSAGLPASDILARRSRRNEQEVVTPSGPAPSPTASCGVATLRPVMQRMPTTRSWGLGARFASTRAASAAEPDLLASHSELPVVTAPGRPRMERSPDPSAPAAVARARSTGAVLADAGVLRFPAGECAGPAAASVGGAQSAAPAARLAPHSDLLAAVQDGPPARSSVTPTQGKPAGGAAIHTHVSPMRAGGGSDVRLASALDISACGPSPSSVRSHAELGGGAGETWAREECGTVSQHGLRTKVAPRPRAPTIGVSESDSDGQGGAMEGAALATRADDATHADRAEEGHGRVNTPCLNVLDAFKSTQEGLLGHSPTSGNFNEGFHMLEGFMRQRGK